MAINHLQVLGWSSKQVVCHASCEDPGSREMLSHQICSVFGGTNGPKQHNKNTWACETYQGAIDSKWFYSTLLYIFVGLVLHQVKTIQETV